MGQGARRHRQGHERNPVSNQLTPRLQLAGMAMQGAIARTEESYGGFDGWGGLAINCIDAADAIISADAQSPSDVNDIARTIQGLKTVLRHLVEAVKEPALVSMGPDQPMEYANDYDHWLAKAIFDAKSVLSQDTESAK